MTDYLARAVAADTKSETLGLAQAKAANHAKAVARFEALLAEPRAKLSETPATRLERHVAKVAKGLTAQFAERVRLGLCNA